MRLIVLALLFFTALQPAMAAGRNDESLRQAAEGLDKALLAKDTAFMNRHLDQILTYGHSNGWIQTSADMTADLFNGKLTYTRIEPNGEVSVFIDGNTGLLRKHQEVEVKLEGQTLALKLSIFQVWIYKKGEWMLVGRQSTRVN